MHDQHRTLATDRPADQSMLFDWVVSGIGALVAAIATTYYMTVTDPETIYERDFVLVPSLDGDRYAGEVLHVHEATNSLAVRVYRDGEPTNEVVTTPAELVNLHPAGRPLVDDTVDPLDNYEFDVELDDDDTEDDTND